MGIIDQVVDANRKYAETFTLGHMTAPALRKLVVVTCMDARMTIEQMLGLRTGDAQILRNAGGIVTEDVIRSLLIAHYLLYSQEFMIINHTECGLLMFKDDELRKRLQQVTGTATVVPGTFHTFSDLSENVRLQIQKVKSHPWVPKHIPVRGFIYDVKTGLLNEVMG